MAMNYKIYVWQKPDWPSFRWDEEKISPLLYETTRMESYFKDTMLKIIKEEALEYSADFCDIVPSCLGEEIGDYSALAVAMNKI